MPVRCPLPSMAHHAVTIVGADHVQVINARDQDGSYDRSLRRFPASRRSYSARGRGAACSSWQMRQLHVQQSSLDRIEGHYSPRCLVILLRLSMIAQHLHLRHDGGSSLTARRLRHKRPDSFG